MKILITGGCGFVGSNLAIFLRKNIKNAKVCSLDNLFRKGSEFNKRRLSKNKIRNFKLNVTDLKKILKLPKFDLVIDCCAEPAIETSKKEPDRVFNTNLVGTFNILKKCVKDNAKIIFLSSSRVYSISNLNLLVKKNNLKNTIKIKNKISEKFNTQDPKSLYGFTKLSSEDLIKEFSFMYKINYIIDRFGVIAGPWQFGKQDQGFFTLWIERHLNKKKLKYIGYGGYGNQVRDVLHIQDLCEIVLKQIKKIKKINNITFNIGGGTKNAISLKELTARCEKVTGNKLKIKKIKKTSMFDIPYFVTDNKKINKYYNWKPRYNLNNIVIDIYHWLKKNKKNIGHYFR